MSKRSIFFLQLCEIKNEESICLHVFFVVKEVSSNCQTAEKRHAVNSLVKKFAAVFKERTSSDKSRFFKQRWRVRKHTTLVQGKYIVGLRFPCIDAQKAI